MQNVMKYKQVKTIYEGDKKQLPWNWWSSGRTSCKSKQASSFSNFWLNFCRQADQRKKKSRKTNEGRERASHVQGIKLVTTHILDWSLVHSCISNQSSNTAAGLKLLFPCLCALNVKEKTQLVNDFHSTTWVKTVEETLLLHTCTVETGC